MGDIDVCLFNVLHTLRLRLCGRAWGCDQPHAEREEYVGGPSPSPGEGRIPPRSHAVARPVSIA